MKKAYIFFATGYEEVEALTVVDILRRAGVDIKMVSVTDDIFVTSSHGVTVKMDIMFDEISEEADLLVLPGGMPGTINLKADKRLQAMINEYNSKGKLLAAICAAPTVYGEMCLLFGKKATCYPGMEAMLIGAEKLTDSVVVSDNFVTSRGLGTAISFGLKLVELLDSKEKAEALAKAIVY